MSFQMRLLAELFILSALLHGSVQDANTIGVIGIEPGCFHRIAKVHPNTPADKAGLKKDDKILKVIDGDGKHEITGPPYTEVTLTIERQVCNCKDCVCKEEKKSCQCSKIKEVKEFTIKRLPWQEVDCKETQDYFRNR